MSGEVIRTKNFVADAAKFIADVARESLADRGEFKIALSGGNTPRPVYTEVAKANSDLAWEKVRFTFGDERCVPPEDPQSNYRMGFETLFRFIRGEKRNVLRMRGEIDPPVAAQEYEQKLTELARECGEPLYQHDLMLLGMGDDGHTASLFPGTTALENIERTVVENFVPKFNTWRLTMTFPLINHARCVCFLINAAKNQELIERVIAGDQQYPAARVQPTSGRLVWILGETA